MWERFTDEAKNVVMVARQSAVDLGSAYVRSEHILLGLLGEESHGVDSILEALGANSLAIRAAVEEKCERGNHSNKGEEIGFTPRAKNVLELTIDEARKSHSPNIDVGHLLLGLIREGEGLGAQILLDAGVDIGNTREAVELIDCERRAGDDATG